MSASRGRLEEYLAASFPGARVELIEGDASARRYLRLRLLDGTTRVVMDYGAPFQGDPDDVILTRIFLEASLPVPRILDASGPAGCLVVEDLGERTLEVALSEIDGDPSLSPGDAAKKRRYLYRRAVDLACSTATRGTRALERSPRAAGPALDRERFRFEMDFYLEHYARGLKEASPSDSLAGLLYDLADAAASAPRPVLCHRDYHSRNLMVLPDRTLAMVDLQDARWGPDTYDLASLLYDAYVDLGEQEIEPMIGVYLGGLPDPPDGQRFRERFRVVAIQRMIKALGTFGYQIGSLGRGRYASAIPRTLNRLRRILPGAPGIEPLASALEASGLLEPPAGRDNGP